MPRRQTFLIVVGLSLLPAVTTLLFYARYALDDMFIYMVYAKNLGSGNGWVFTGNHPAYGFTSPLYTAILAGVFRIAGPSFLAAKILPVVFSIVAVLASGLFAFRLSRGVDTAAIAGSFIVAVDFFTSKFTGAGLETSAAVATVLLTLWSASLWLESPRSIGRSILFIVITAASPLLRPELALLAAFVWIALAVHVLIARRTEPAWMTTLLRILVMAVAASLPSLAWLLYAHHVFGTVVPNTVLAKTTTATPAAAAIAMAKVATAGYALSLLVFLFATIMVLRRRETSRVDPFLLSVGWAWVLAAGLGFILTGSSLSARYWLIWLIVPAAGVGWAIVDLSGRLRQARRRIVVLFLALVLAQQIALRAIVDYPWVERYNDVLYRSEIAAGKWLDKNAPPDAKVAASDIGAVAWFSNREVVDLVGLVDPQAIKATRQGTLHDYLRSSGAEYLLAFDYTLPQLLPNAGDNEVIFRHTHLGYRVAKQEPFDIVLLKLRWPDS